MTASGKASRNGAVVFTAVHLGERLPAKDWEDSGQFDAVPLSEVIGDRFLALSLNCVRCHDHPFTDELNQKKFWGFNAALRQLQGQIALLQGDPKKAVELYGEARLLEPDDNMLLEQLMWAQYAAEMYGDCHESVKRLQDWIKLPSIAAENRNMNEGCQLMMDMLKDAGFQSIKKMPTDGHPGVFATLDAGAPKTLGIYFMYDVKQFDPKEWSSPPLDAATSSEMAIQLSSTSRHIGV